MRTGTDLRSGPTVLRTRLGGRVRFEPPRTLCGELEFFRAHETIATVTNDRETERIVAPSTGFLRRVHVSDGVEVGRETPLVVFCSTGDDR
ncbi:MAG TPA: hypothetical protein VJ802_10440 [Gemmatimonadaceae bacterium]|nr:hypothetical protein [Gemmatimonadaceae bacterium]